MTSVLDKAAITAIPQSPYRMFRRYLASGDLVFMSGNDLISRAIRTATGSPWSRVGIVIRADAYDRVMVIESIETTGVCCTPLSWYFHCAATGRPYDGEIVVARHLEVDPAAKATQELIGQGLDLLARRYDWRQVGSLALRLATGAAHRGDAGHEQALFSSELVDLCFERGGGHPPFARGGTRFISPGDIWRDPRVIPIRRLVAVP